MPARKGLIKDILIAVTLISPLFTGAQIRINDLITTFQGILSALIPLFMILATVIFLWGVIRYITAGGEEEKIKAGRSYMLWGIIALFVMVAVWGLVNIIASTTGIGTNNEIPRGVRL